MEHLTAQFAEGRGQTVKTSPRAIAYDDPCRSQLDWHSLVQD
jgi:hypothetical protein